MKRFYITTPIYYVNDKPHLGHAYTTIIADTINRFYKLMGYETFFLTGTDEHGDKIVQAAKDAMKEPKNYVDEISQCFRETWDQLQIHYDKFIRTSFDYHKKIVQYVIQKLYEKGEIYLSEYEGKYCFGCERFLTEKELVEGKCPDHAKEPSLIKEANYFFSMGHYQQWLINYIKTHPDFIQPQRYRNEVLSFLKEPLVDLCISRPKKRLSWGIPLPFDKDFVVYVWFDALLNYLSALDFPSGEAFKKFWPVANHIIAKDILKPHSIYWPIMLHAAGLDPYQHLYVHGYWNVGQQKMSKSLANVVSPLEVKEKYGLDAFRYFLLREMPFGLDANFSEEALVERLNADLANDLGNLFNRTLAMVHKFNRGIIPTLKEETKDEISIKGQAQELVKTYIEEIKNFAFHKALSRLWDFIGTLNKYIDSSEPWSLAKSGEKKRLNTVLYVLVEGLRLITFLLKPIMPQASKEMEDLLNLKKELPWTMAIRWAQIKTGIKVNKPTPLFPRKELPQEKVKANKEKKLLSIEYFSQLDIRVGEIIEAQKVDNKDKLLKLKIDLGKEQRNVVAGIAKSYKPQELIGKKTLIVANLKPIKIGSIVSEGMILAALDGERLVLTSTDVDVKPGTKIK
jgi:methionyl-tRNA synthetase